MSERASEFIERLGTIQRGLRRRHASDAGLSLAQLDALTYLVSCNRFSDTPAAVALFLDATRGTTSQTLRALERKDLLTREGDHSDGRVQHLRPTEEGRRIAAAAAGIGLADGLAAIDGTDRAALTEILERVLRATQRARGGRSFGECDSCAHLRRTGGDRSCGLTGEPLTDEDRRLRCAEHHAA